MSETWITFLEGGGGGLGGGGGGVGGPLLFVITGFPIKKIFVFFFSRE